MFEACFGCLQVYSARPQQRDMQYSSFKVDTAELKLQDLDLEVQRKDSLGLLCDAFRVCGQRLVPV